MPEGERFFYEFGAFCLQPHERLLLRAGEPVRLQAKAFDTLLYLVENGGHLVTKAELLEKVWADSFVEENNLTKNISALRKVLQTGGGRFIETVPRRGYRFAGEVRRSSLPAADASAGELLAERESRYRVLVKEEITETAAPLLTKRKILSAVALCAVALFGAAIWWMNYGAKPAGEGTKTLAVIPLRNLKAEAETDFLSYALAESITGRLGYVKNLAVRPVSSTEKFRAADPPQIARELNVQTILTGSYVREGASLRINLELIDAERNRILWQDAFDVQYEKLSTVQERVAADVVRGLRLTVDAAQMKSYTPHPSAYEYDLRGLSYGKRSDYRTALKMYEKAVEIDPDFALAWTHLSAVYYFYGNEKTLGAEYRRKSEEALERALALEPDQIEARLEKAFRMIDNEGRGEEAIPILRGILQTNGSNALAHWHLSQAYRYGGALTESIDEAENAVRLDPDVMSDTTLNTYFYAGFYDKFLDSMRHKPEGARTCFYRGLAYVYLKDHARAATEFDRAFELDSTYPHAVVGRTIKAALEGQAAEGERLLREFERGKNITDGEMLYKLAQAYALLGIKEDALRLLRRAVEQNFFCYPYFAADPLLDNLRGERAFHEFLNAARERHEAFRRNFF